MKTHMAVKGPYGHLQVLEVVAELMTRNILVECISRKGKCVRARADVVAQDVGFVGPTDVRQMSARRPRELAVKLAKYWRRPRDVRGFAQGFLVFLVFFFAALSAPTGFCGGRSLSRQCPRRRHRRPPCPRLAPYASAQTLLVADMGGVFCAWNASPRRGWFVATWEDKHAFFSRVASLWVCGGSWSGNCGFPHVRPRAKSL